MSKGLGYAYFDNSNVLLRSLLEREVGPLNQRIVAAFGEATDFEGRLRATIGAWFDHVEARGVLLGRLVEAARNDGPHVEARDAYNRFNEQWWADLAERELGVPNGRGQIATAIILAGLQAWCSGGRSALTPARSSKRSSCESPWAACTTSRRTEPHRSRADLLAREPGPGTVSFCNRQPVTLTP